MSFAEFRATLLKVCNDYNWKVEELNENFKVSVPVRGAPKDVAVTIVDDGDTGEEFARFMSIISTADILDPEFCLKINGENRFLSGCLAIMKDRLIFLDSQLVSQADPLEIAFKLNNAAKFATAFTRLANEAKEGRGTGRFVRKGVTRHLNNLGLEDKNSDQG